MTNKAKTLILTAIVLIFALSAVNMAAAQSPNPQNPIRDRFNGRDQVLINAISEATGLEMSEIIAQASQEGVTLSDVITQNGGDVEAVKADVINQMTEQMNTRLDEFLSRDFGENVRGNLDLNGDRIASTALAAAARDNDVDMRALRDALSDGETTVRDGLTSLGADPNTIATDAKTLIETRLGEAVDNGRLSQEQADELLATADSAIQTALDNPHTPQNRPQGGR